MPFKLPPVLSIFTAVFKDRVDLVAENVALRHQLTCLIRRFVTGLMGFDSNRYAQLFDLLERTDLQKDGLPAYEEIAWTMWSRSMSPSFGE